MKSQRNGLLQISAPFSRRVTGHLRAIIARFPWLVYLASYSNTSYVQISWLIRYWVWNKTFCWWCVCYREIKDEEDTMELQRDIDRSGSWARKLGMRFRPVKCNMMKLTRKRINKIHASYTLEGTDLENVESIKYFGETITSDLRWNTHVSNVCTKANRTLGFLRRNLHSCPQEVKEAAYKGLVRPVLDYGSSVWDPPGVALQEELESVQKRAARFVTGNYNYGLGVWLAFLDN